MARAPPGRGEAQQGPGLISADLVKGCVSCLFPDPRWRLDRSCPADGQTEALATSCPQGGRWVDSSPISAPPLPFGPCYPFGAVGEPVSSWPPRNRDLIPAPITGACGRPGLVPSCASWAQQVDSRHRCPLPPWSPLTEPPGPKTPTGQLILLVFPADWRVPTCLALALQCPRLAGTV